MRATKVPRAVLEQQAHEQYLRRFPHGTAGPPEVANGGPLLDMEVPREFEFLGRAYRLDHLSHRDGIRLQLLVQNHIEPWLKEEPSFATLDRYAADCHLVAVTLWELARPVGWRRFVKKFLRNHFLQANDQELGELCGFFWSARTRSSVRIRQSRRAGGGVG